MKKKNDVKREKLKLHRETLRSLTERDLQNAVGGNTIQLSCDTVTHRCGTLKSDCC